jgi:hypothetical protein
MAKRYTYFTTLNWGGDEPTGEMEVEVSYEVRWGSPPILSGPPERCDPGSDDEIEDIRVETIDGKAVADALRYDDHPKETMDEILDKLELDHAEAMIEAAADKGDF